MFRILHASSQRDTSDTTKKILIILRLYLFSFVETPRKFIIAELSIRKLGSSSVLIILMHEDPSLQIESSAIINLRGVSTKLNKYIVFTMQTYKKLILRLIHKGHGYNYVDFRERERKTESQAVLIGKTPHEHAVTPEDRGGRQILIYSCLQTVKKQSISKELNWAEIYEYLPPQ